MKISKKKLERLNTFDLAAEKSGGYVEKMTNSSCYHIRDMHKWRIANNRDIGSLTSEEREMFKSSNPNVNKAL